MSDFLLSDVRGCADRLSWILSKLTWIDQRTIKTWEGPWGSLAAPVNHYQGYDAYEDNRAISIVIGGPLHHFASLPDDNVPSRSRHTVSIRKRVFESSTGSWHHDLLGPFCFLHVDKLIGRYTIVTDNMSFIPAYTAASVESDSNARAFSTHPDAAALAVCEDGLPQFDPVSVCDFILHKKVTYPHTLYRNVQELAPATVHSFTDRIHTASSYWRPSDEGSASCQVEEAAEEARNALREVLQLAGEECGRLCFLLSAGEDSRTLACMTPEDVDLHCVTIAPSRNREAHIARQVANLLNASWEFVEQPPNNYLHNLGPRSLFSGSNGLSFHAHMMGIVKNSSLSDQPIVIGGFGCDAFLKGHFYKTRKVLGLLDYHRYVRNRDNIDVSPGLPIDADILTELRSRRRAHEARLHEFRLTSTNEWMSCWPMSQDHEIVNVWSNRRLFSSLEAFMCPRILDVAAALAPDCVVNRKLFQKMAAPVLGRARWIPHGEGHFPAFPWYANVIMRPAVRAIRRWRRLGRRDPCPYAWPSPTSWLESPLFDGIISEQTSRLDPDASMQSMTRHALRVIHSQSADPYQQLASAQVLSVLNEIKLVAQQSLRRQSYMRSVNIDHHHSISQ